MSEYRRFYVPGGTYFFTAVTYRRRPLLTSQLGRQCLRKAIASVRANWPIEIVAFVLLPDHLHTIWTLPGGDDRYSTRWKLIKEHFTREYLASGGREIPQAPSRARHAQRGVWHRRFWEHTCRDEDDVKRCADYIHWNPKKHGLVQSVSEWPYSSFGRFVDAGEYSPDWGRDDPTPGFDTPEWDG